MDYIQETDSKYEMPRHISQTIGLCGGYLLCDDKDTLRALNSSDLVKAQVNLPS